MVSVCYYCGEPADSVDHVIPQVVLKVLDPMDRDYCVRRIWEVAACRDCNSVLGTKLFPTIRKRVSYLKGRLRSRYKRLLVAPRWEDWETMELGDNLRSYVEAAQLRKRIVLSRLAWQPARSAMWDSADNILSKFIASSRAGASPTGPDALGAE